MKNKFMSLAIEQAKIAYNKKEIPVGAVIVKSDKVIAKAYNQRESTSNSLAHAEIIAINEACRKLNSWRLSECDIYVTLEPCPMCSGAILQSRIKSLYFGAFSKDNGCMGTVINLPSALKSSSTTVYGGIMEEECSSLISEFLKQNGKNRL
ncbi:MAG: nucleoside deaminase [Clostridia bacterium]|nr:nucleoside deaminase [Clostridia bacterium]